MIADIPSTYSPALAASETYGWKSPTQMVSYAEPRQVSKPTYTYRRTIIPMEGGKVLLRLRKPPIVEVDPVTLECEVKGWGVRIPHTNIVEIDRRMARRFLDLYSKATSSSLNEYEKDAWLRILDEVNYEAFCIDRAAPHYVEGVLLRNSPECRVEWHDGTTERLSDKIARALEMLEAGDRFGAFVKLGRNGEAIALERVTLVSDPDAA